MTTRLPSRHANSCTALARRSSLDGLYTRVRAILEESRSDVARTVNSAIVRAYWLIGREIVEEEQGGNRRAEYGEQLVEHLAERLRRDYGPGFTPGNLRYMRLFYRTYPHLLDRGIRHALRDESDGRKAPAKRHAMRGESVPLGRLNPNLSWTHYRILLKVESPPARSFYEVETVQNHWSSRALERQIDSLLFERLARSRDKKGLLRLARKGQEIQTPGDAIKDPVVLEFLDLPESHRLVESRLQEALLDKLQAFLLELGKGFAYLARQKRITLDGDHFYVDLVFYHVVLKCYILVDLKTAKLTHSDLGQMQLYVNYFDSECLTPGDNPTVGLILCTDKNDTVVRYTLGDNSRRIFASRYKLYLPDENLLACEIDRTRATFEGRRATPARRSRKR